MRRKESKEAKKIDVLKSPPAVNTAFKISPVVPDSSFETALKLDPFNAEALAQRAHHHVTIRDNLDGALRDWSEIIKLRPNDPTAFEQRALVLMKRGDRSAANNDFRKAEKLVASAADNAKKAGECKQKGHLAMRHNDVETAIKEYTKAIGLTALDESLYVHRGMAFAQKGDKEAALRDGSAALRLNPNCVEALLQRASVYWETRQFAEAALDFAAASNLTPNLPTKQNTKAMSHAAAGWDCAARADWATAVAEVSRAIELNAFNVRLWKQRATAHMRRADYPAAVADYTRAIALIDTTVTLDPEVYDDRGSAWLGLAQWDNAAADFLKASQLAPTKAAAELFRAKQHNAQGTQHYVQHRFQDAIAERTKAIQLNGKQPLYLFNRGCAYMAVKDFEAAIRDFSESIRLGGADEQCYAERAHCYRERREYRLAADDFATAATCAPDKDTSDSHKAHAHVCRAFEHSAAQLNDMEAAIREYTTAAALAPTQPDFYRTLGVLCAQHQDWPAAVKWLCEAIRLRPRDVTSYERRAKAYAQLRQWQLAAADFGTVAALLGDAEPDKRNDFLARQANLLAGEAHQRGEFKAALCECDTAVRLQPNNASYWFNRALTQAAVHDYGAALADCTRAIQLAPAKALHWLKRGDVYRLRKDYEAALADYGEALRLKPSSVSSLVARAQALSDARQFQRAADDYDTAARVSATGADQHKYKGLAAKARAQHGRQHKVVPKAMLQLANFPPVPSPMSRAPPLPASSASTSSSFASPTSASSSSVSPSPAAAATTASSSPTASSTAVSASASASASSSNEGGPPTPPSSQGGGSETDGTRSRRSTSVDDEAPSIEEQLPGHARSDSFGQSFTWLDETNTDGSPALAAAQSVNTVVATAATSLSRPPALEIDASDQLGRLTLSSKQLDLSPCSQEAQQIWGNLAANESKDNS